MSRGPILFTSDWQASWSNLARVRATVDHIVRLIGRKGIVCVVHAGDIKEVLNPVDQRVTNAIMHEIGRIREAGAEFVAVLGNHDRVANRDEAENWFPVLEKAGALVATEPTEFNVDGTRIHALPYMNDVEAFREGARYLARAAQTKRSVLVFHHELSKAKLNMMTQSQSVDLTARDLLPNHYMFCIGGHLHLQQNLSGNVWYVGSPFACDWGEANQPKGFLLLYPATGHLVPIAGRLPGFYDPSWPGFEAPKTWTDQHLRLHVPVDPTVVNVQSYLDAARKKAATDYPGALLTLVPEEEGSAELDLELSKGISDEAAVTEYVRASIPEALAIREAELVRYITCQVENVAASVRSRAGNEFLTLEARNVMSYEELSIDYARKGIHVVAGVNEDWPDRSNGTGKTSYLQMLAVALFGRNTKGQQFDQWMRRNIGKNEESWVKLTMRLGDGRTLEITRGRKPKGLSLVLAGKDVTAGKNEREVQRDLELITGLTWEVAVNALFVDQRETNQLLAGTDTDRKQIFTQFLNLERFAKAQALVKQELTRTDRAAVTTKLDAEGITAQLDTLREQLANWTAPDLDLLEKQVRRQDKAIIAAKAACEAAEQTYQTKCGVSPLATLATKRDSAMRAVAQLQVQLQNQLSAKAKYVGFGKQCPECGQVVDSKHVKRCVLALDTEITTLKGQLLAARKAFQDCEAEVQAIEQVATAAKQALHAASTRILLEQELLRSARKELSAAQAVTVQRDKVQAQANGAVLAGERLLASAKAIEEEVVFLRHAVTCLSKDGVPAFIGARLIPKLNRAARHYADLFCDSTIRVEFQMNGEDIDVAVLNEFGGAALRDQSAGETRMASIITSFALRDVMSPCNLLIADEPGDGLDESNARQFARGLKECAQRFKTILLTSHNAYVLSELSDQRQIIVTKQGGISCVTAAKKGQTNV